MPNLRAIAAAERWGRLQTFSGLRQDLLIGDFPGLPMTYLSTRMITELSLIKPGITLTLRQI